MTGDWIGQKASSKGIKGRQTKKRKKERSRNLDGEEHGY